MKRLSQENRIWLVVILFASGMAWVEAASVYYLRALVDRIEPYQENPLPVHEVLGPVELVREAATLVMLLTVGMLAARRWQARLAYTAIAFGVWDILYYVFLRIMTGWPRSILDWDILFLLPLPWWGPVLAPVSIAVLMIVWGTFATQLANRDPSPAVTSIIWGLGGLGIALALYVFMSHSVQAVREGLDVRTIGLPTRFDWPMFCGALALLAAPVVRAAWQVRPARISLRPTGDPDGRTA